MKTRLNNEERRLWVLNDEGLYRWWMRSRKGMRAFIKENREEIDAGIRRVLDREPIS